MLANRWNGQPVAGWWLSEKFDGVRAFWDGKTLRTRTWRSIDAPAWFTAALPQGIALDGELWGGRGTLATASNLSRFQWAADAAWRDFRFMVFDAPTTDAVSDEQRREYLSTLALGDFAQIVGQRKCRDVVDVVNTMHRIVNMGGEGLVLRKPASFYEFGRSSSWLKVKPAHVD